MPQFERNLYSLFENLRRQMLAQPLNLGGITASGGGTGGPPGGFIGQLPQYRSTFDESELAVWKIPGSGIPLPSGQSLLTNLNRIRYRLGDVETAIDGIIGSGVGGLDIQENDITILENATILNFEGAAEVVNEGSGKVTVTVSGIEGPSGPPGSGIPSITIEEDGIIEVALTEAVILNFTGSLDVTNDGGGQVTISGTGEGSSIGSTDILMVQIFS